MKFFWFGIAFVSLVIHSHGFQPSLNYSTFGDPLLVKLTLIKGAAAKGAVCLDGSLPGYHLHRGYGSGANSWLIQLEGGSWCESIQSCVDRKITRLGSSTYMEKEHPFIGILNNRSIANPEFYNWNRAKIRYCDGASFAGEGSNEAAKLQFRGRRIWLAAMQELMSVGMRNADQALLSGCSAGGLAAILHCDEFSNMFPVTTRVKCLSDAGLFLDVKDILGGHTVRKFFSDIVNLHGIKANLACSCKNHLDPTSCFFPENLISGIRTPMFLLNTAYDTWQISNSIAPLSADPSGKWNGCKSNHSLCSDQQVHYLQGFRKRMLHVIKDFSKSKRNGAFIDLCFSHCQGERQDSWFSVASPIVENKIMAVAFGDWFFDRARVKIIDCAYPCDNTCPYPVPIVVNATRN